MVRLDVLGQLIKSEFTIIVSEAVMSMQFQPTYRGQIINDALKLLFVRLLFFQAES